MTTPIAVVVNACYDDKLALLIALDLHHWLLTRALGGDVEGVDLAAHAETGAAAPFGDVEAVESAVYVETDAAALPELLQRVAQVTGEAHGLPHPPVSLTVFHPDRSTASVHLLDSDGAWSHLYTGDQQPSHA